MAGTYNISVKFCKPDRENGTNPTVQVLTHGLGFDKTYWDLPFNDYNYSYLAQSSMENETFTKEVHLTRTTAILEQLRQHRAHNEKALQRTVKTIASYSSIPTKL